MASLGWGDGAEMHREKETGKQRGRERDSEREREREREWIDICHVI